jgi:hypothetical protein
MQLISKSRVIRIENKKHLIIEYPFPVDHQNQAITHQYFYQRLNGFGVLLSGKIDSQHFLSGTLIPFMNYLHHIS